MGLFLPYLIQNIILIYNLQSITNNFCHLLNHNPLQINTSQPDASHRFQHPNLKSLLCSALLQTHLQIFRILGFFSRFWNLQRLQIFIFIFTEFSLKLMSVFPFADSNTLFLIGFRQIPDPRFFCFRPFHHFPSMFTNLFN